VISSCIDIKLIPRCVIDIYVLYGGSRNENRTKISSSCVTELISVFGRRYPVPWYSEQGPFRVWKEQRHETLNFRQAVRLIERLLYETFPKVLGYLIQIQELPRLFMPIAAVSTVGSNPCPMPDHAFFASIASKLSNVLIVGHNRSALIIDMLQQLLSYRKFK
jgi:hypothetical protein